MKKVKPKVVRRQPTDNLHDAIVRAVRKAAKGTRGVVDGADKIREALKAFDSPDASYSLEGRLQLRVQVYIPKRKDPIVIDCSQQQ